MLGGGIRRTIVMIILVNMKMRSCNTWNTPICSLTVIDLQVGWIGVQNHRWWKEGHLISEYFSGTAVFASALEGFRIIRLSLSTNTAMFAMKLPVDFHGPQTINHAFLGRYSLEHKRVLKIWHTLPFASSCRRVIRCTDGEWGKVSLNWTECTYAPTVQ